MDRHHYSRIRHSTLSICSPLSQLDIDEAIRAIGPMDGGCILEIGCGKSEILARLMKATNSNGIGVDLPGSLAEEPSPLAMTLMRSGLLKLHFEDAGSFLSDLNELFDVLIVSGSSQAVGGFDQLPSVAKKLLKPEGHLVLGELAWLESPDLGFLDVLKMDEEDLPKLSVIPEHLSSAGFKRVFWRAVPQAQFFQYEQALAENGISYARNRPADPSAVQIAERSRNWFELMSQSGLKFFAFGWGVYEA